MLPNGRPIRAPKHLGAPARHSTMLARSDASTHRTSSCDTPLGTAESTVDGDTPMSLKSRFSIGLAALALSLATSALTITTPALAYQPTRDQTSEQQRLVYWDVAVKFKDAAFRPVAQGNGEDVAFEIQNLGADVKY